MVHTYTCMLFLKVSLGVYMKNENKHRDKIDIMHTFITIYVAVYLPPMMCILEED